MLTIDKNRYSMATILVLPPKGKKSDQPPYQAEQMAEDYEHRRVAKKEAKSRSRATVNKKSSAGRGKKVSRASSRKRGRQSGH